MRTAGVIEGGSGSTVVVNASGVARPPVIIESVDLYTDVAMTADASMDPQLATRLGFSAADLPFQVRITRTSGEFANVTIVSLTHAASDSMIGLSSSGFAKLDSAASTLSNVSVSTTVVDVGWTSDEADPGAGGDVQGRLVERARWVESTKIIACAPHGGDIEAWTSAQADAIATGLACNLWACDGFSKVYATGGFLTASTSAYARFHTGSEDINPRGFPLLSGLWRRGFTYPVSCHGLSDETCASLSGDGAPGDEPTDVLVGGGAPNEILDALVAAIIARPGFTDPDQGGTAPDGGFQCRRSKPGDAPFTGTAPSNFINQLAGAVEEVDGEPVWVGTGFGVQLEQGRSARNAMALQIAQAVIDVFALL